MIAGVADTHTTLWYLLRNPLLSIPARNYIAMPPSKPYSRRNNSSTPIPASCKI